MKVFHLIYWRLLWCLSNSHISSSVHVTGSFFVEVFKIKQPKFKASFVITLRKITCKLNKHTNKVHSRGGTFSLLFFFFLALFHTTNLYKPGFSYHLITLALDGNDQVAKWKVRDSCVTAEYLLMVVQVLEKTNCSVMLNSSNSVTKGRERNTPFGKKDE